MQMEFSDFLIVGLAAFFAIGILARMMNAKRQQEMDRFEAELREIQDKKQAKQEEELKEQRKKEQEEEFQRKRASALQAQPATQAQPDSTTAEPSAATDDPSQNSPQQPAA